MAEGPRIDDGAVFTPPANRPPTLLSPAQRKDAAAAELLEGLLAGRLELQVNSIKMGDEMAGVSIRVAKVGAA